MTLPEFLLRDDDGFIHFRGHRIGIQNVLNYYNQGYSPEMLACEYETLSLALIHKLIAFYLESRQEVEAYIKGCQEEIDSHRAAHRPSPHVNELRQRLTTLQEV